MKKHLLKVLSIVSALTMVLGMFGPYAIFAQDTSADPNLENDEQHTCVWGDVVVDDITCNEKGEIVAGKIYRECTVEGCDKIDNLVDLTTDNIFEILGVGCQEHKEYKYELTLAPTCTTDGKITFTCPVCGDGYGTGDVEIPVKKLGHIGANDVAWNNAWTVKTPADCHNTGLEVRDCARCGHHEEESIPALNHNITEKNPNGNFEKINPTAVSCDCAATKVPADTPIEKVGTCYQAGWIYEHCTLCHDVRKVDNPKSEHPWETTTNAQGKEVTYYEVVTGSAKCEGTTSACDCTKATLYFKVCSICGFREEEVELREEAVGHTWESKVWDKENVESAFCETKGWEKVVDATRTGKASCHPETVNYYVRECKVCHCEEKVNYFFDEHVMTKYVCDVADCVGNENGCADCKHAGRELVCAKCDTKSKDAVYTDHKWVDDDKNDTPATCTTNRIDAFKCGNENCVATKTEEAKDSTVTNPTLPEHHSNWVKTHKEDSTCTVKGFETGYCTDCSSGVVRYELPLAKHTEKVVAEGYAQTCTTAGKKALIECAVCGVVLQEAEVIPADGKSHPAKVDGVDNVATVVGHRIATCTIKGATIKQYSGCGCIVEADVTDYAPNNHMKYTYDKLGNKTGEASLVKTSDLVPATCVENGNHEYTYCEGCAKIISINYTSCAGNCKLTEKQHKDNFDAYIGTSYKTNGQKLTIAPIGHDFQTYFPFKAETCNTPGNQATIYCARECCQGEKLKTDLDMGANTLVDVENKVVYLVEKSYTVVDGVRVEKNIAQNGATIAPHGYDHIVENEKKVPATCTEAGKEAGKFCALCDDDCTFCDGKSDHIDPLGHDVVNVATVNDGLVSYDVYKCGRKNCYDYFKGSKAADNDNTYTDSHGVHIWYAQNYTVDTVPAPVDCEHAESEKNDTLSVAETCTASGVDVYTCKACKTTITDVKVVPAHSHKNAEGNVIYLDCQSNYKIYDGQICDECGVKAGENIYHNFVFVQESEATCEKAENAHEGVKYYQCADCDVKVDFDDYTGNLLSATYELPETMTTDALRTALYVSTVEYVPATSIADGSWTWNCVCGDSHTTVLKYQDKVKFDLTVNPYTYNTDAEQDLEFVNGGLIEVLVSVTAENLDIKALNYTLDYDKNVLEFVSAELVYDADADTEGVQNDFGQPICNDNAGTVKFLAMTQVGVDSLVLNGEAAPMIKYVFRVGEGVNTIAIDDVVSTAVEFNKEVAVEVTFVNLNKAIEVELNGDFNDDGMYTVDDVLALQEIINNPESVYTNVGDFNNDGRISIADFAAFAKFITSKTTVADYYTLLNGAALEKLAQTDILDDEWSDVPTTVFSALNNRT